MALWTPTSLSNLRALWDADSIVLSDGSAVETWPGSVNGYNLTQTPFPTLRPTIQTNEINGHSAVRFDGADDWMTINSLLGLSVFPTYTFGVWKMANAVNQGLLQWGNFCGGQVINSGGNLECYNGTVLANAITKNAWRMTLVINNGASSRIWIDGTLVLTGNSGTTFPTGSLHVGVAGNQTAPLNGDIATIEVLTGNPGADEIDRQFGWAAHRFGLTASLPGGHPYKTLAPTIGGFPPLLGTWFDV